MRIHWSPHDEPKMCWSPRSFKESRRGKNSDSFLMDTPIRICFLNRSIVGLATWPALQYFCSVATCQLKISINGQTFSRCSVSSLLTPCIYHMIPALPGFSPGARVSSHSPKTLEGNCKLAAGVSASVGSVMQLVTGLHPETVGIGFATLTTGSPREAVTDGWILVLRAPVRLPAYCSHHL